MSDAAIPDEAYDSSDGKPMLYTLDYEPCDWLGCHNHATHGLYARLGVFAGFYCDGHALPCYEEVMGAASRAVPGPAHPNTE